MIAFIALLIPQLLLVPLMVYLINGASDFKTAASQMAVIYLISGLFDRLFIDWYWVGKTKAWIIPGTEEIPFVQTWPQVLKKRGILTLIWIAGAAIVAGIIVLLF